MPSLTFSRTFVPDDIRARFLLCLLLGTTALLTAIPSRERWISAPIVSTSSQLIALYLLLQHQLLYSAALNHPRMDQIDVLVQ